MLIPTPEGWRRPADLVVGDHVFAETGAPCTVLAVEPRMADRRIRLADATALDVAADQVLTTWDTAARVALRRSTQSGALPEDWPSWRILRRDRWGHESHGAGPRARSARAVATTLTTGSRGDHNHSIPLTQPLRLPPVELPIEPWLLGYWLGDGHSAGARLTVHRDAVDWVAEQVRATGRDVRVSYPASRAPNVNINGGLLDELRQLGVLRADPRRSQAQDGCKHVPDRYLWANEAQRADLLAGLLDSDGCVSARGQVEFCSTVRALADAVVQLARSLGQKPVCTDDRATFRGRDCGPRYRVRWRATRQVFRMPRKAERVKLAFEARDLINRQRMIIGVERIDARPSVTLRVDSPSGLYLAGEALVPIGGEV